MLGTVNPCKAIVLRQYTPQEEGLTAQAMANATTSPQIEESQFVTDYGQLRNEVRACQGVK